MNIFTLLAINKVPKLHYNFVLNLGTYFSSSLLIWTSIHNLSAFCELIIAFIGFLSYCFGIDGYRIKGILFCSILFIFYHIEIKLKYSDYPVLCQIEGAILAVTQKIGLIYISMITWSILILCPSFFCLRSIILIIINIFITYYFMLTRYVDAFKWI
jgi:hypothetical protein